MLLNLALPLLFAVARLPPAVPPHAALGEARQAQSAADSISVRVTLPDGHPAAQARVLLSSDAQLIGIPMWAAELLTDDAGLARFDHVKRGSYSLVVRLEPTHKLADTKTEPSKSDDIPCTPPVWWAFTKAASPASREIAMVLSAGVKQALRVKTASGVPIDELQIRLTLIRGETFTVTSGTRAVPTVLLDRRVRPSDGRLVVDGLVPGEWACVLSDAKYGRTTELSLLVPAGKETEFIIPRFISISGEVRAPDGAASVGTWVGLKYPPGHLFIFEDGQVAAFTDKNGKFVISNARPGTATLKAEAIKNGGTAERELLLDTDKDVAEVRLELQRAK
jgi:hypothetical protein